MATRAAGVPRGARGSVRRLHGGDARGGDVEEGGEQPRAAQLARRQQHDRLHMHVHMCMHSACTCTYMGMHMHMHMHMHLHAAGQPIWAPPRARARARG